MWRQQKNSHSQVVQGRLRSCGRTQQGVYVCIWYPQTITTFAAHSRRVSTRPGYRHMDTAFQPAPIRHLQLQSHSRLACPRDRQNMDTYTYTTTALGKPLLHFLRLHVMRPKRNLGMSPLIPTTTHPPAQDKSHLGTIQSQLPFAWLSAVCRHPATTFFTTHQPTHTHRSSPSDLPM